MPKKLFTFILPLVLLAGCNVEKIDEPVEGNKEYPEFTASMEQVGGNTKTCIDEKLNILWNENDQISIFCQNDYNAQYGIKAGAGSTQATLELIGEPGTGTSIPNYVAVYPYNSGVSATSKPEGFFLDRLMMPVTQHYVKDSFDPSAFIMWASSEDMHLKFKNYSGILKFSLTGSAKIKSIHVMGNNLEYITGKSILSVDKDGVQSNGGNKNEATLICDTPVQLSATPTDFMIGIYPCNFTKGFTVIISDTEGGNMTLKSAPNQTVERNQILKMPVLEYVPSEKPGPGLGEVWVKTVDGSEPKKMPVNSTFNGKNTQGYWVYSINEYFDVTPDEQFRDFTDINEAWIGEGIMQLNWATFRGCTNLKKVILPASLKTMLNMVFKDCTSLEEITLPENFKGFQIEDIHYTGQFDGCTSLKSIHIPDKVSEISNNCFRNCTGLQEITVGQNTTLTRIGAGAFQSCTSLKQFTLPSTVQELSDCCFQGCSNLTEFIIPEDSHLGYISMEVWGDCPALKELYINGPVNLGYSALQGVNLDRITFSPKTQSLGSRSMRGTMKEMWILFDRKCNIADDAFHSFFDNRNVSLFLNSDWMNAEGFRKPNFEGGYSWMPEQNPVVMKGWKKITLVDAEGTILDPQPLNM